LLIEQRTRLIMPLFARRKVEKLVAAGDIDALLAAFAHPEIGDQFALEASFALQDMLLNSPGTEDSPVAVALAKFAQDHSRPVNRRRQAIREFSGRGGRLVLQALTDLLDDETREDPSNPFTSVRSAAIEALAFFKDQAFDPLLADLERHGAEDPQSAGEALESLVKFTPDDVLARKVVEVQSSAALAAVLNAPLSVGASVVEEIADKIQAFRALTAEALGKLGGKPVLETLLAVQAKWDDPLHNSQQVLAALAAFDSPRAMQAVEDVLVPWDSEDRGCWDAARNLAVHGNTKGRRALVKALVEQLSADVDRYDFRKRRSAAWELRDNLSWAEEYLGDWAVPALQKARFGSGINWNDEYDSERDWELKEDAEEAVGTILRRLGY